MRGPYARVALFFHLLGALCIGYIAFYRGELYRFPTSAWALAAVLGAFGLFAPLAFPARMRVRLLAGTWPLVSVLPFVALVLGPKLVPSPLTAGPFFFCAGASLTTCALVARNESRRKRSLRRLVEHAQLDDALARSQLEIYFAAQAPLLEEALRRSKPLRRALRAQAWLPSQARRAHAAALLREYADFLGRASEAEGVSLPSEFRTRSDASRAASERTRAAFLKAAVQLEEGGRLVRWRKWLRSFSCAGLDADRDLLYAVHLLARRHGVVPPASFRTVLRLFARSPLTPRDVEPPTQALARVAKPVTVVFAVVVVANALVATATAQQPPTLPNDSRPLPVIAGPSAESRIDPQLSRVASMLAGRRAEVRCWSREDWDRLSSEWARWPNGPRLGPWSAYASRDRKRVHLAPLICESLSRLGASGATIEGDPWADAFAWSVVALAHEAQHVRGIRNEAVAECYAMQSVATATQALGRTREDGRYLASRYWAKGYLKRTDPAYRSRECRNGGRLDLHPETDVWP